jgi:hypothetical protein
MVENECESNCDCLETQRSSENSNVANECSCCCCQTTHFCVPIIDTRINY